MLDGVRTIGKAVLGRTPLVEALVDTRILEQGTEVQGKKGQARESLVVTLDVHLNPLRLEVDVRELDERALVEVLWVGNAARNSPQDRLTTDKPRYLASQTVPNLLRVLPADGELAAKLCALKERIYLDLGEKDEIFPDGGDQQYERHRWIWDLPKLRIADLALLSQKEREVVETLCREEGVDFLSKDFLRAYAQQTGRAQDACALVDNVLKAWISREIGIKSTHIKLYTLALEGEKLVQHPDYRAYIERRLVDEAFEGREASEGICHICGSRGRVTSDTTRFKLLKFYNTDKPGFASGLRDRKLGGFLRNYTLCERCYRALLAGERFVENELRTQLERSAVYPIPTFHAPEAYPTVDTVAEWAEYLKARLSASGTLEQWHTFQQELEKYQRFEGLKGAFVLNLLFATKRKSAVKVDKLIANVPPSRLDRLDEVRNAVRKWAGGRLGEDAHGEWDLSLGKLFYLLPLRKRDRQAETKLYLELLDALLTGQPLRAHVLISQFMETACIHRFERYEAYVHSRPSDPERTRTLVEFLLQSQLFLHYLRELGQLQNHRGGEVTTMVTSEAVEVERSGGDESMRAWMDGLGLVGSQRGLFLLGVLIGKIGSTREQRDSRKPILNKVHFQGMDRNKLLRLANEVYEKLRQYKIADYNEGLYAAMKAHLDRALGANELGSPQENVYWVLSGYAYATQQAIHAGQLKHQAGAEATETQEPEREEALQ